MSIIKIDQKRLDNIAKAYWNTSGDVREMWGRKWYELIKNNSEEITKCKLKYLITH
jgi:hypothetical protein